MPRAHDALRSLAAHLREFVPPLLPVRVYVRDSMPGAYGMCWLRHDARGRPTHFVIAIRRSHWSVMRDTLLHEWAHARAWSGDHASTEDHGAEWGLAMSAVYQEAVEP